MITDNLKDVAKGTFASSFLAIIGALVVYTLIKGWQSAHK